MQLHVQVQVKLQVQMQVQVLLPDIPPWRQNSSGMGLVDNKLSTEYRVFCFKTGTPLNFLSTRSHVNSFCISLNVRGYKGILHFKI